MARLASFVQGTGENGNDDDSMRDRVASGQALGPPSPSSTPPPEPPGETSDWLAAPGSQSANPFAPSAPLPTSGSNNYGDPGVMGPPPRPPDDVDRGPQSEQPGRGIFAGPSVLSPEQQQIIADYQASQSTTTEMQYDSYGNVVPDSGGTTVGPNADAATPSTSSGSVLDFSGGSLGGPNPWDRTTPSPEPEEEDEGGGSWWDWAPGDFDLDSIPQRALNVIGGAGDVDQTIQNAVDPRVAPVPESEELDYVGGLEAETREWAQEQVDTAQWIASDPIGAGKYLGNPTNWPSMAGAAIRNYRDNPEDAVFDFGFGLATSAGTGAATAGAGGLIYRGLSRLGAPDVPPAAVSAAVNAIPDVPDHVPTPSSVIRTASGVPVDQGAPAPSPGVARLMDEATSPAPAAAPDVLGPQYQLPDVAPAVRNAGAPEVSGPQYQLPDAVPTRAATGAPEVSGPQYQLPDVPVRAAAGAPDMSGPRYQMPDAPAVSRAVDAPTPVRSLADMDAEARAAAPDVEDVADVADAPGSILNRMDARWNRNIERRQQRRSARQPSNIARRIVGRDQVFKPYTLGQRTSTRIGDWVGGGPGVEGSPNLLRQYVRSRLNKTDTMPEFPEGTNRALTGYERSQWRNQQLMRQPNRVRRASHAVGSAVEAVEDVKNFLDMDWGDEQLMPEVSMYGDDVAPVGSPGRWKRPTNPRFAAAAQKPASQAYGQTPYTMGRGYSGGQ